MFDSIMKRFVKNCDDLQNQEVRTNCVVTASMIGIFCNMLLFFGKMLAGVFMHSIAVMADAFNNLSDAASSIVSFVGMKMASKPADEEHPFGHGRIEYIAAFIVAFLVIEVGLTLFKSSVGKIVSPDLVTFRWIPFLILGCSVGVKIWLGSFYRKVGRKIDSKMLEAAAADSFGDVAVTAAAMVSIVIGAYFKIPIDGYAGLLVSIGVMWAGVSIAKDTLEPLIGSAADPELSRQILSKVESYDGVLGTHDLIVHNYGPNRSMATVHAEVPKDVDIEQSHEIIDRIEREAAKELGIFLVIHMDPVETKNEEMMTVKKRIHHIIEAIDGKLSFHDFRMVKGGEQIDLIFDVVFPFGYTSEQEEEILQKIKKMVAQIDSRYECVILVEHSYVAEGTKDE